MTRCRFITLYILSIFISFFLSFPLYAENSMVPLLEKRLDVDLNKPMKVSQDSVIYAVVGGKIRPAGWLLKNSVLLMQPAKNNFYRFHFGNSVGYITQQQAFEAKKNQFPADTLKQLDQPVYDYLVTTEKTPIYENADEKSTVIGFLSANLRYPVLSRIAKKIEFDSSSMSSWFIIDLGGRLAFIDGQDVSLDKGIPILTYHHLLPDNENKLFRHISTTTSVTAFKAQMDYLKQAGYQTITLDEVDGYLKKKINLPGKVVSITFDDGLKSVYRYAYPILKAHAQLATLFVISSRIKFHDQKWDPNGLQFMSRHELKNSRDVFDIQSHSHFLHRLDNKNQPIIFSRSYRTVKLDFAHSRRVLAPFNPFQRYLAYPFGAYNGQVMDAAKAAGMMLALTTIQGKVKLGDNPYALKRLYALRNDPMERFAQMVGNGEQQIINKDIIVDQ